MIFKFISRRKNKKEKKVTSHDCYLGMNCHCCGPFPNWRNYGRKQAKLYIRDVEKWAERSNAHKKNLIAEIDNCHNWLCPRVERWVKTIETLTEDLSKIKTAWTQANTSYPWANNSEDK